MKEENLVRVRRLRDGTLIDLKTGKPYESDEKTDWERVRNMTEEEVIANALSDPDNPPSTEEELKRMRRVPNVRTIREKLKMTQIEFSETFDIPLGTLRDWEQHVGFPGSSARNYLWVIDHNPEAVIAAIEKSRVASGQPDEKSATNG